MRQSGERALVEGRWKQKRRQMRRARALFRGGRGGVWFRTRLTGKGNGAELSARRGREKCENDTHGEQWERSRCRRLSY